MGAVHVSTHKSQGCHHGPQRTGKIGGPTFTPGASWWSAAAGWSGEEEIGGNGVAWSCTDTPGLPQ